MTETPKPTDANALARQFEDHRSHLRSVAYRMLGTPSEADDAVQEAWLRLSRSDGATVNNLGGWLTTVVARVCLDMLRSRKSRREEPIAAVREAPAPEPEASLADSIGPALLVVLETLAPAERLAFVLHDMFGVAFDEIAPMVGRTPAAARQLASRARRRVRGAAPMPDAERERQRELIAAFIAASREGSFDALLAVLAPDVVIRADATAVGYGAAPEIHGVDEVFKTFAHRARGAKPALVDGVPGAAWIVGGAPRVVFGFTVVDGKITEIELIGDPAVIEDLDVER